MEMDGDNSGCLHFRNANYSNVFKCIQMYSVDSQGDENESLKEESSGCCETLQTFIQSAMLKKQTRTMNDNCD
jgi:hypothetical protein